MRFIIAMTRAFERDVEKLDNSLKIEIQKELSQLEENPYVGKPLGFQFFREKKV